MRLQRLPVRYVVYAVMTIVCLWFGFVAGVNGALNVGLFLVWLQFVISLLNLSTEIRTKAIAQVARSRNPLEPIPLFFVLQLIIIGLLVWNGAWITAIAALLRTLIGGTVLIEAHGLRRGLR